MVGNGSLWDRMPVWLRVVAVVGLILWFVPPMALMALKAAGAF